MSDVAALLARVDVGVRERADQLIELRRHLHANPELSWAETRTTAEVSEILLRSGVRVRRLPSTGLVAEVGPEDGPAVLLRADIDALPVDDRTDDPWQSTVAGVAHACGHDLHTTALVGATLALADLPLPRRIRMIFQPAEEVMPGGALTAIDAGVLDDAACIFGLHCDPGLDVGLVGLREGPLTGAADAVEVLIHGEGGHTSRPHLTQDLTFALGKLVTELPAALSRRLDPRAGVSVVWGLVQAGAAQNVIPATGRVAGTIRMLDALAWTEAEPLVRELVEQILAPYGVKGEIRYVRGVPPVVNEHGATTLLGHAVEEMLGPHALVPTPQSLGGEDFAWYLEQVPGAMARLGTRTPGGPTYDLHQGNLRIDERALVIGTRLLARAAVCAMSPESWWPGSGEVTDR